jgi:hypothetical protein
MRSEASRSGYKAVLLPVPKVISSSPPSYIPKQTLQVRSDQFHHNEISRGLSTPVLLLYPDTPHSTPKTTPKKKLKAKMSSK